MSQPPMTANGQPTNNAKSTATTKPIAAATTTRRIAGACQPMIRWYAVGGGRSFIRPPASGGSSQPPYPERFSLRFACLSARLSFSDFPGFLAFVFFGDLSPIEASWVRFVNAIRSRRSTRVELFVEGPVMGGEPRQLVGGLDGVRVPALAPLEAGSWH